MQIKLVNFGLYTGRSQISKGDRESTLVSQVQQAQWRRSQVKSGG